MRSTSENQRRVDTHRDSITTHHLPPRSTDRAPPAQGVSGGAARGAHGGGDINTTLTLMTEIALH
eukprot:COSAG01_NODE_41992_length_444_cov_10.756522_1_plen_64_part_01